MPLALFQNIGVWEILLLLLVLLLVFGPKRLPEMGRSLGRGMREFKESITGQNRGEEEEKKQTATLAAAPAEPAATSAPAPAPESERVSS